MKKIIPFFITLLFSTFVTARTIVLTMSEYQTSSIITDELSLSGTKGTYGNAVTYNSTYGDLCVYAGGTLTIATADTAHIKSIIFNISTEGLKRLPDLTVNTGIVTIEPQTSASWAGYANSITFTLSDKAVNGSENTKAAQLRFLSVTVVTTGAGEDDADGTVNLDDEYELTKGRAIYYGTSYSTNHCFFIQLASNTLQLDETWDTFEGGRGAFATFDIYAKNANSFVGTYTKTIGNDKIGGLGDDSSWIVYNNPNSLQSFLSVGSVTITWIRDNLYNVTFDVTDKEGFRHQGICSNIEIPCHTENGTNHTIINEQTGIGELMYAPSIYTHNGKIIIEKCHSDISIYNTIGRCIYKATTSSSRHEITISQAGIYIVKTGNQTTKIIL
ncbi:MAG: T9SS type A sorting domain-containing protein [Sphingobacteriia bacterium]|jgi:hypothetical protein|nr:T9SS type A sorting domain-containing protein [Sphingobacteriia bacterium]